MIFPQPVMRLKPLTEMGIPEATLMRIYRTRGQKVAKKISPGKRFQSTLPYRERPEPGEKVWLKNQFQSTLPYRERRFPSGRMEQIGSGFNPRSHIGSDPRAGCLAVGYAGVSIHAPI